MKTITVLGSTGSVGRQVLNCLDKYPNEFKVVGLSAFTNEDLLRSQIEKYNPTHYYYPQGAVEIQTSLFDLLEDTKVTKCVSSLQELAELDSDIVVSAVSGISGLWAALATLKRGATLAIANKETIVCAGTTLKKYEKKYGGKIVPVDSEHSAIFNCLKGEESRFVKSVILTASGGALRDLPFSELSKVKPEDALKHPTWSMGKKVTVDSATLFNKGMEVIEAARLFDLDYKQIQVLMHRESIIHSMVEFTDNGIKAYLSQPDMALSIENALFYPERSKKPSVSELNLSKLGTLNFSEPDYERYPCLKICFDALKAGEVACAAISIADEVLVDRFLHGKLKYLDIPKVLEKVLKKFKGAETLNIDDIITLDTKVRDFTYKTIGAKR